MVEYDQERGEWKAWSVEHPDPTWARSKAEAALAHFRQWLVPESDEPLVSVPREALKALYECALSYDERIPEGNGGEWAAPFHAMFGASTGERDA